MKRFNQAKSLMLQSMNSIFETVLAFITEIENEIHSEAGKNIKKAQKQLKRDYVCRHFTSNNIHLDYKR